MSPQNTQPQVDTTSAPMPVVTGVRKRQQIENTNKRIFIWLAVAAVIVSVCLVLLQFLVREFLFNQKVINKMGETNNTLSDNIAAAKKLQTQVNGLLADRNLDALKYQSTNGQTSALNVILDALPTEGDATAFATSLQAVILPRSGVAIRDLPTTAAVEGEGSAGATDLVQPASPDQPGMLPFITGFDGDYNQTKGALVDIARVIRPINVNKIAISVDGDTGKLKTDIGGVTYYVPARVIDLKDVEIKP